MMQILALKIYWHFLKDLGQVILINLTQPKIGQISCKPKTFSKLHISLMIQMSTAMLGFARVTCMGCDC